MKPKFSEFLETMTIYSPLKKVIRNIDLEIYEEDSDIIYGLVEQIDNPVLFQSTINFCILQNIDTFYDVYIIRLIHSNIILICFRLVAIKLWVA